MFPAVVDILDIKWESLIQQDGQKSLATQRGSALKRFSAQSIFSQIGISTAFAGEALVQRLKSVCQQQMNEEIASAEESESGMNNSIRILLSPGHLIVVSLVTDYCA